MVHLWGIFHNFVLIFVCGHAGHPEMVVYCQLNVKQREMKLIKMNYSSILCNLDQIMKDFAQMSLFNTSWEYRIVRISIPWLGSTEQS